MLDCAACNPHSSKVRTIAGRIGYEARREHIIVLISIFAICIKCLIKYGKTICGK